MTNQDKFGRAIEPLFYSVSLVFVREPVIVFVNLSIELLISYLKFLRNLYLQKMQGGRPGRDNFFGFGDPFAGFGGLRTPGSLISSIFGGRDPFDDPFFTQPFGAMMGPSLLGQSIFGARGNPFGDLTYGGFLEDPAPRPKRSRGPIIEELSSDDEEQNEKDGVEKEENARKRYNLGKEPFIEEPEEEMKGDVACAVRRTLIFKYIFFGSCGCNISISYRQ